MPVAFPASVSAFLTTPTGIVDFRFKKIISHKNNRFLGLVAFRRIIIYLPDLNTDRNLHQRKRSRRKEETTQSVKNQYKTLKVFALIRKTDAAVGRECKVRLKSKQRVANTTH